MHYAGLLLTLLGFDNAHIHLLSQAGEDFALLAQKKYLLHL